MRQKTIFFSGCLVLIIFAIFQQIYAKKVGKRNFAIFNEANINSNIDSVYIAYKGTGINLMDGRKFVFYPYTDLKLNHGNIFRIIASKGDQIIKKEYGDTVFLYKNNKCLKYTFAKF